MTESVPPRLADLARKLQLGALEARYPYRPGVIAGPFLAVVTVFAVVGLFVGILEGNGALAAPIDLPILALLTWRISRAYVRFRGGVYLFEGGIAEAYGNRVRKVFTWREARKIQRRRTVTLLNFIPLLSEDEYLITAHRADVHAPDGMLLDSTLIGARQAVRKAAERIGQTSPI